MCSGKMPCYKKIKKFSDAIPSSLILLPRDVVGLNELWLTHSGDSDT